MRGGARKRGQISKGRTFFKRLGAWFGLNHGDTNTFDEIQNSDAVHELKTQQSQAATSSRVERDEQTTNDSAPVQATPTDHPRPARRAASTIPVRPRGKSQRILQKKLSKINSGAGSSRLVNHVILKDCELINKMSRIHRDACIVSSNS
ncbi:hypothetical protein Tco_0761735 [Tanacetum coccineum]